jgi:HNH endonuclease
MAMTLACMACQQPVKRSPSHVKGRVFCSVACRRAFHRPQLACAGCLGSFARVPSRHAKKYCSWECFKKSRHVTLVCVNCSTPFDSYLSEARKRQARNRMPCCSTSCRNSYTSKLFGGDGTWIPSGAYPRSKRFRMGASYFAWRRVRQLYLAAVGGTCEGGCGGARAVQVHHLVPVAMGGPLLEFDNLMAVCLDCHENMHWQLRRGDFDDCLENYLQCSSIRST